MISDQLNSNFRQLNVLLNQHFQAVLQLDKQSMERFMQDINLVLSYITKDIEAVRFLEHREAEVKRVLEVCAETLDTDMDLD